MMLPDSRLRDRLKGVIRGFVRGFGTINWTPIYCADCGIPYGYVPEENCDFVCWLCNDCSDKYGEQYGLALMPEEVFWEKTRFEQLEKYGRLLNPHELQEVAEGSSSLAKLLRDKR